jgi:hypothetical protein
MNADNPLHILLHHLDWVAATFTLSGKWALGRRIRAGWIVEIVGGVLWFVVASLAVFSGRPIYAQMLHSVIGVAIAAHAFVSWGRR